MQLTSRVLPLLIFAVLMTGCKLAVIVVEGGEIQSTSSGTCVAGAICIVDVTDPNFSETFTAVPDEGWYFQKWNSGDGFFCTGSTYPTCRLSFQGHEESKAVADMVASSETFYLMTVFKPYQDIITVDGKEWLQPYLFVGLSWNQINEVCPDGTCTGMLKGQDMNGWTWASVEDMNDLFNYYIGSNPLGPGPDSAGVGDVGNAQSSLVFDGWHPTFEDNSIGPVWAIVGLMKDELNTDPNFVWCADWNYLGAQLEPVSAVTNCRVDKDINKYPYASGTGIPSMAPSHVGAWFYRVP